MVTNQNKCQLVHKGVQAIVFIPFGKHCLEQKLVFFKFNFPRNRCQGTNLNSKTRKTEFSADGALTFGAINQMSSSSVLHLGLGWRLSGPRFTSLPGRAVREERGKYILAPKF